MSKQLPSRASLRNLKNQAKQLLKDHRAGRPEALARIGRALPKFGGSSTAEIGAGGFALQEAQHVIASEYGCAKWADLVAAVGAERKAPRPDRWMQAILDGDPAVGGISGSGGCSSHNGNDRAFAIQVRIDLRRLEVKFNGEVELADDEIALGRMAAGTLLVIAEKAASAPLRVLRVAPGVDGRPEYGLEIDGRRHPFDRAAEEWLCRLLPELFYRQHHAWPRLRARDVLARRGLQALLDELGQLWMGVAPKAYLLEALDYHRKDAAALDRVADAAAEKISGERMAEFLTALIDIYPDDRDLPLGFVFGIRRIGDAAERRRVLATALQRRRLSESMRAQIGALVKAAEQEVANAARGGDPDDSGELSRDLLELMRTNQRFYLLPELEDSEPA